MRTATVREIRTEFPKIMRWLEAGEEVIVTRRRKIVASLVPATDRPEKPAVAPAFLSRLRARRGGRQIAAAVMKSILDENRGRY